MVFHCGASKGKSAWVVKYRELAFVYAEAVFNHTFFIFTHWRLFASSFTGVKIKNSAEFAHYCCKELCHRMDSSLF